MRVQAHRHILIEKKYILSAAVIAILLVAGILTATLYHRDYVPPAFEKNVVSGVPTPDASFRYGGMQTDYNFSFMLAATLFQQEDQTLKLYFTNPADNGVNLQCEIVSSDTGKTLYKSGVLKPGEYVESLSPETVFSNTPMNVNIKIYAFQFETWHSEGTVIIENILQPW